MYYIIILSTSFNINVGILVLPKKWRKLYIHRIPQRDDAFGALTRLWAALPVEVSKRWLLSGPL